MYKIELPGCRVFLRPVDFHDAFTVVNWRNTMDSRDAFFNKNLVTPDTHAKFVETRSEHDLVWMACLVDELVAVGMTSVTIHDPKRYIGEYGRTYVDHAYRGQGYAKEIEYLMLWAAFEWMRVEWLWLDAYADNEPIVKLHYDTGWTTIGKNVFGHTDPNGDVIHMRYKREDWRIFHRRAFADKFGVTLPEWIE